MPFSVTDVPDMSSGLTDPTLRAPIGDDGPPQLLLPGWPQFWYLCGMGAGEEPAPATTLQHWQTAWPS